MNHSTPMPEAAILAAAGRRLYLSAILDAEDVAHLLRLRSASAARRRIRAGDCGPYFRLGRRIFVRKESILAALAAREVGLHPSVRVCPRPLPSAQRDRASEVRP